MIRFEDTIAAPATASGGALAVIRVSGSGALEISNHIFRSPTGKTLLSAKGNTTHFGTIISPDEAVVDEVLVSVFRTPLSFTGEDTVEISCHGSQFIVSEIIKLLIENGARAAEAGEFTMRAYLAGKLDLSQAEAVADMISSRNKAEQTLALKQMRGGYSDDMKELRDKMLRAVSLLELELDFPEEDVDFVDRTELLSIIEDILGKVEALILSFSLGNVIKHGITVAIVGSPNAGKSTLLNYLLHEDRAMVSDIPGTTRDIIEERLNIDGIDYRFIDTAGLRDSGDTLELMGMERTHKAIERARIVLLVFDTNDQNAEQIVNVVNNFSGSRDQTVFVVLNKCDAGNVSGIRSAVAESVPYPIVSISAKFGHNMEDLISLLRSVVDSNSIYGDETVISNTRHYEALLSARDSLRHARESMQGHISGELLVEDLRAAIEATGSITGQSINSDEVLGEIFSKFCIGK